jgi:hypothetical protein
VTQEAQHDITKATVVYSVPGVDAATVRRDVTYKASGPEALTMDIYYPGELQGGSGGEPVAQSRLPAVIFVLGYSDVGFQKMLGCRAKEMGSYTSWSRLVAASGLAAITYTNREPMADIHSLLSYVRDNAAALGIDETRIGLWACSGNVPAALAVLMQEPAGHLKCAALCYGFMMDVGGATTVSEASRKWGFVNGCVGKGIDDLPRDVPLFIARAGQDEFPGLNTGFDAFVHGALACNLPITVVNHAAAPHAFDLTHDSATSREIVRQILVFMQFHLLRIIGAG